MQVRLQNGLHLGDAFQSQVVQAAQPFADFRFGLAQGAGEFFLGPATGFQQLGYPAGPRQGVSAYILHGSAYFNISSTSKKTVVEDSSLAGLT